MNIPIKECPHCGGKCASVTQYIHGIGEYYIDLETGEIDGSEFHANLRYRNTRKYATCIDCGKRLFNLEEVGI